MTTEIAVATALSAGNLALLAAASYVWLGNYRRFRTPLILGLLAFGLVLALENALAIVFFFSTEMLYAGDELAQLAVVALRALQFVALCFLVYVTAK